MLARNILTLVVSGSRQFKAYSIISKHSHNKLCHQRTMLRLSSVREKDIEESGTQRI